MPDYTADEFVAKILETPGDDTPRLAYADWLDEHIDDLAVCPDCKGKRVVYYTINPGCDNESDYEDKCPTCRGSGAVTNGFAARAEFIRTQVKLSTWKDGEHCPECGLHRRFGQSRLDGGKGSIYHCNNDHKWHSADHAELRALEQDLFEQYAVVWFGDTPGVNEIRLNPAADLRQHAIVRRGFVDETRYFLRTWMGGEPCERCDYTGSIAYDPDNPTPDVGEVCPDCHGTGRNSGIAGKVRGAHPVTICVLTDVQPVVVVPTGHTGLNRPRLAGIDVGEPGEWFFRRWNRPVFGPPGHDIPIELFDLLQGAKVYPGEEHLKFFASSKLANAALSVAAVEWGRKSSNPGGI